jgi:hypothetical protein
VLETSQHALKLDLLKILDEVALNIIEVVYHAPIPLYFKCILCVVASRPLGTVSRRPTKKSAVLLEVHSSSTKKSALI